MASMMESTTTAPSTISQPSRKGKKAWRKNVDISEVQQGLEDLQTALIQHGGVLAEKDADTLFATDIVGDEEVAKKQNSGKKLLKAEEILALRSAVPGLEGRKKRKADDVAVNGRSKKARDASYVTHKELQRLKAIADGKVSAISAAEEEAATHDPWASAPITQDPQFSFLDSTKPKSKREPKTLKHPPTSLTANGKHLPNVPVPHAGKSYNPLVGDWSALLTREGELAVEAEIQRLQAEESAAAQEARAVEEAAKVEATEREEYATDYDSAWESEWDGILSGNEGEIWTQKQKGRKTPVERKRVEARRERERKESMERKDRERVRQEKQVAKIAKEVSAKDRERRAHVRSLAAVRDGNDSSSDNGEEVELRPARFGQQAIPDAPLEVVLPEELEDSLRRLKPEGDLLQERYRNLLVSGKVENRKLAPGPKKQRKGTRSEKWSYKDWKLR